MPPSDDAQALRKALVSLRPYFGKLKPEKGEVGTSHWQPARDAFALIDMPMPDESEPGCRLCGAELDWFSDHSGVPEDVCKACGDKRREVACQVNAAYEAGLRKGASALGMAEVLACWLLVLSAPGPFHVRCDRLKVFYGRDTWHAPE